MNTIDPLTTPDRKDDAVNFLNTPPTLRRRSLLNALASLSALAAVPTLAQSTRGTTPARTPLEVWKDPDCGCCKDWVAHMEASGFAVTVHESGNNAVRAKLGLPTRLGSCHTALVGGYLIEGHVPASDVRALLRDRPAALGLAVPGMPVGAPGMDGPVYGNRRDRYDVLLVSRDGATRVFRSYPRKEAA